MDCHMFTPRSLRRAWMVAAVSAVALVGCGTSVPSTTGTSTTASSSTKRPTDTTASPSSAPSTTAGSSSVTVDDLAELLPTAAQVGADYRVDPSTDDGDDPDMDAALKKSCPKAASLMNDTSGREPSADRTFKTDDDRSFEVELKPDSTLLDKVNDGVQLDEYISAINDCDVISYTDSDDVHYEVEFEVQKDTEFGDLGIKMQMRVKASGGPIPKPVEFEGGFRKFLVGDVGVSVSATSGLDSATFEPVPADYDLIDPMSEQLEGDVAKLVRNG
jgi:hypothetical protein